MCGMLAFSGPKDKTFSLDKIKLLYAINQERGKDSFGFYTPTSGIIKDTGTIWDAMQKKDFTVPNSNLLIGHVRHATIGNKTKDNAHPFNYGNIVLAMNGTLDNHWNLLREYDFNLADFDVDTQVLTAMLNKDQNKDPLTKIIGGCAVIYTDTNTGKLYVYRNDGRPLFRGNCDGGMYISSIESTLKVIGCTEVKEFKQDILYEIIEGKVENHIKIKRSEVAKAEFAGFSTEQFHRKLNFQYIKSEELIGEWLVPNHTISTSLGMVLEGYPYLVIGKSSINTYELMVKDHNDKHVVISKYSFKDTIPLISEGDYVFCTDSLTFTGKGNSKKYFCEEGQLLKVLKANNKNLYCENVLTKQEANVPREYVRYTTQIELKEYMEYNNIREESPFEDTSLVDTQTSLSSNQAWLAHINRDPRNFDNSLPPAKLTEEEIYTIQVKETELTTYEALSEFTLNSIDEINNNLEQMNLPVAGRKACKRIKMLLENFLEKVIILDDMKEEETEDASVG